LPATVLPVTGSFFGWLHKQTVEFTGKTVTGKTATGYFFGWLHKKR
jgi:hypothetical protein